MSHDETTPPLLAVEFTLNGKTTTVNTQPRDLLIDVLREQLALKGTKRSCDSQVCGACTVLVDDMPTSSCTTLCADVHGRSVTTIEGLGDEEQLDAVQQAFIRHGAMQCGFCTPGMILAIKSMLKVNPNPSEEYIRHYLRGNICRCTGYVKIIEAVSDVVTQHHQAIETEI